MRHMTFRRLAALVACAVAAFVAQSVLAAGGATPVPTPMLGIGGTVQIDVRSPGGRLVRSVRRTLGTVRSPQAGGRVAAAPVLDPNSFSGFFGNVNPFFWTLAVSTTFPDTPTTGSGRQGQVVEIIQQRGPRAAAPYLTVEPHMNIGAAQPLTFSGSFVVQDPQGGREPGTIQTVALGARRGSDFNTPTNRGAISSADDSIGNLVGLVHWFQTGVRAEVGQQVQIKIALTFSVASAGTVTSPQ